MVGNEMADKLAQFVSQSIYLPIEETVRPPIRFKKAIIEEAVFWKPVARYLGPSGRQSQEKEPATSFY